MDEPWLLYEFESVASLLLERLTQILGDCRAGCAASSAQPAQRGQLRSRLILQALATEWKHAGSKDQIKSFV